MIVNLQKYNLTKVASYLKEPFPSMLTMALNLLSSCITYSSSIIDMACRRKINKTDKPRWSAHDK